MSLSTIILSYELDHCYSISTLLFTENFPGILISRAVQNTGCIMLVHVLSRVSIVSDYAFSLFKCVVTSFAVLLMLLIF
jgi:hypothetical protein